MKNTVVTQRTAIRIPKEMADKIDMLIKSTGDYTNRPDFIISSMKYLIQWVRDEYLQNLDRILDEDLFNRLSAIDDIVTDWWEDWADEYYKYSGDPQLIFLRVPVGLIDRWEITAGYTNEIKNLQDFLRLATAVYIRYVTDEINVDGIVRHIVTAEEMDMETMEEYRKLRSEILERRGKPYSEEAEEEWDYFVRKGGVDDEDE